ncbi:MAG: hypothetical protein ACI3XP_05925 [Eubacteriales bacterium]
MQNNKITEDRKSENQSYLLFVFIAVLTLQCFSSPIFAEAPNDEYFHFSNSATRMNYDGSFDFRFYVSVTSDHFIATSNTLTIATCVSIYNMVTESYETSSDYMFGLTLYKNDFWNTAVGSYVGCADGIYGGLTFTVEEGCEYYFRIMRYDDRNAGTGKYYDGYGNAYPISLVEG